MVPVRTYLLTLTAASSVADPHHVDADPDPTFHFAADPGPDPSFQIKAKTLKKCPNRLLFHTFWLVICKLIPDPAYHFDADSDPTFQFEAIWLKTIFVTKSLFLIVIKRQNNLCKFFSFTFFCFCQYFKICHQCCGSGSGIRCLFDPWIRDPE
jgi:hypothetical protein